MTVINEHRTKRFIKVPPHANAPRICGRTATRNACRAIPVAERAGTHRKSRRGEEYIAAPGLRQRGYDPSGSLVLERSSVVLLPWGQNHAPSSVPGPINLSAPVG